MHDARMKAPDGVTMNEGAEARLQNILGSVAVAIADEIHAAAGEAAGHAAAAPAALTALRMHEGASVDQLARVLGLSHSGTVRVIDRLEGDGLVRRGPASDGRAVSLELTAAGAARAAGVSDIRATVVDDFLAGLDDDERRALTRLLEKIVVSGMEDWTAVRHRCRLCDLGACHADGESCPLDLHMAERAG
jgi:DNA-binding MarR family transcriptional regulator